MPGYPRKNNYLALYRADDNFVIAYDFKTEEAQYISKEEAKALCRLDGKTPPGQWCPGLSKREKKELLRDFREKGFLRDWGRLSFDGVGSVYLVTTIFQRKESRRRKAAFLHRLLSILWLPVMAVGIFAVIRMLCFGDGVILNGEDLTIPGVLLGLFVGIPLHECAHAAAALRYGGEAFEGGVGLCNFLPCAFVALNDKAVKNKLHRIRILTAGIEMNLFLGGFFLLLSVLFPAGFYLFYHMGSINLITAFFNLSFFDGMDGCEALGEMIGVRHPVEAAKHIFWHRDKSEIKKLRGVNRMAIQSVLLFLFLFQGLLLFLVLSNLLQVVYLCVR